MRNLGRLGALATMSASLMAATGCNDDGLDSSPSIRQASQQLAICEGADAISEFKELMVVDSSVMISPEASNATGTDGGALSFRSVMTALAGPGANVAVFTEAFLSNWKVPHDIGAGTVEARPNSGLLTLLENNAFWPRLANGELDMSKAPFRLLAVANRIDLASSNKPAGEGRLVFGVVGPASAGNEGQGIPMTLITEFNLPTDASTTIDTWAQRWHDLGDQSFGAGYNTALASLVSGFVAGENLSQLRTSEVFLGGDWQLREFHLQAGALVPAPTAQAPDPSVFNTQALVDWVEANEADIEAGVHVLPTELAGSHNRMAFPGGPTFNFSGTQWLMDDGGNPLVDPDLRTAFASQTCNGCHQSDIPGGASNVDAFYQVSPTRSITSGDGKDRLSSFIVDVEIPKRAEFMANLLPCDEPTNECTAEYIELTNWGSGSEAAIKIHNNSANAVQGWNVSFAYNDGTVIGSFWSATATDNSAPDYAFENTTGWNASIAPGSATTFGFITSNPGSHHPAVTVQCDFVD